MQLDVTGILEHTQEPKPRWNERLDSREHVQKNYAYESR